MSRFADLALAVIVACIALALTFLAPENLLLRAIFGLPFVLLVPGYAITAAAFPNQTLGWVERLLLSLGMSLATIIVGSLLLYRTSLGLNTYSWAILLFSTTVIASLLATIHRVRYADDRTALPHLGLRWSQLSLLTLAALLVIAAVNLARTPLPSQGIEGYTELSVVPVSSDSQNVVHLTVDSKELATTRYAIKIQARGQNIQEWSSIELSPGQQWETTLALGPDLAGEMVQAFLYRLQAPNDVYRQVAFWPSR